MAPTSLGGHQVPGLACVPSSSSLLSLWLNVAAMG